MTLTDRAAAAVTRDALAAANRLSCSDFCCSNAPEETPVSDPTETLLTEILDALVSIDRTLTARLPKPDPEAYERAAAEYQSLRETQERASEQQAEALTLAQQFMEAIKGDPCPCGCRRDVEPTEAPEGTGDERLSMADDDRA